MIEKKILVTVDADTAKAKSNVKSFAGEVSNLSKGFELLGKELAREQAALERIAQAMLNNEQQAKSLAEATKGLSSANASLAATMVGLPKLPDQTGTITKMSTGLKRLGIDVKEVGQGFKEMGKGLAMDAIRDGLGGVGKKLQEVTGLTGNAAMVGAQLGGVWGALIGLGAELLSNKLDDWFNAGIKASIKASKTYIEHMDALTKVDAAEVKLEESMRDVIRALDDANPAIGGLNRILNVNTTAWDAARAKVLSYGLAVNKLQLDKLTGLGKGVSPLGLTRDDITAQRGLRDATAELNRQNSIYGDVVYEVTKRENAHADALADTRAAFKAGELSAKQYREELKKLGVTGDGGLAKGRRDAQTDLASWYQQEDGNVASLGLSADDQRTRDMRRGYSTLSTGAMGQYADVLPRDEFGRPIGIDTQGALTKRLTDNWNEKPGPGLGDGINAAQSSQLAGMFGPLSDFNAYKTAFDTLGGAVGSAMDAWIDGSESAGKAFKHFVGDALKGLATQMAVESLKEGAYAIASLAMYNFDAAGKHAAAAGAFAVGAAAAAVGAKALGTSASSSNGAGAGASSGGAPSTLGTGGGDRGQSSTTVVYADAFAEDSPRGKQRQARKIVQRATGNNAVRYS